MERTHTNASYWTDLMSRTDDYEDLRFAARHIDAELAAAKLREAMDLARRRMCRADIRKIVEEELNNGRY